MFDLFETPIERLNAMLSPGTPSPTAHTIPLPTKSTTRYLSGYTVGDPGFIAKAQKRSAKKARKLTKKMRKAGQKNAFGRVPFAEGLEAACDKAERARIGKIAKDPNAPRGERLWALGMLDKSAFVCQGEADAYEGKRLVAKAAKKEARVRRARLEQQALSGDVHVRARALDLLCPIGGSY